MPKVSVITPIYNTEAYLEKCLFHLVGQTLADMEFIWVDNAANDKCKEIISKYERSRPNIKVIHLQKNVGYSGAMNLGLEKATGDFIGFCDSDDWVDDNYYEQLYSEVSEGTDAVYCGYMAEYPKKKKVTELRQSAASVNALDVLISGTVWNGIYKNELIRQTGTSFNKNGKSIYRDMVFAAQFGCFAQKFKIADNTYYHFMKRKGSTTDNLPLSVRTTAAYEILEEIFANPKMALLEKDKLVSLSDFLMRSLPLTALKKFPKEAEVLVSLDHFKQMYKQTKAFSYPSFWQRIYSVSHHISKPVKRIRLLGLSVKVKTIK